MHPICPHCSPADRSSGSRTIARHGSFRRASDQRVIQRFRCLKCRGTFSKASFDPCFKQHKRQLNQSVFEHLSSGVSQRRLAYLLRVNRKTVKRKFVFLGIAARAKLKTHNLAFPKVGLVEFDDLETFEHTKCKPVSVTLAVHAPTRRILDFAVSSMPAKGLLVKKSLRKYGPRKDERAQGRAQLFHRLRYLVQAEATFKSDENPLYPADVRRFFPKARHLTFKGRRGADTGQGELKKIVFDPIFSLNHTCAKFRADINRLIRKTWCTTKLRERLELHIALYALYHNRSLTEKKSV